MTDTTQGGVGYLTWDAFERLRNADEKARKIVPWLRVAGYLKSGTDPDEFRSRNAMSHPPLGLPATWLAAEEISRLSSELNQWATLEDAASDDWGAEVAWLFTREVETADAKWPIVDRARAVKFFRCTACNQQTLRYYPPSLVGETLRDSVVKCTDKTCRAVIDELMFKRMAVLIEKEWELRNGKRRVGDVGAGQSESGPVASDDLRVDEVGESSVDSSRADSVAVLA